jgi:hypothetical protein
MAEVRPTPTLPGITPTEPPHGSLG